MDWRPFDVTVITATDIKNVNYFSTMNVYVEISIFGYAKNTKKTFVDKRGGTSPKWNYPVKFTLDEPSLTKPGLTLFFRIRSKRLLGDKDIGVVSIPINDIFSQSASGPEGSAEKIVEYQVFTPVTGKPKGTLKFSYKFGKKYEQPAELMYKNVNQPNGLYNGNTPVTAYPFAQNGPNNMPPPGMGYGMPGPNHGMGYGMPSPNHGMAAYQQPPGYPPAGYGYPPQQQQVYGGYPPINGLGMGAGLGLGLAGGLLGGMVVGEMVSDVGHDMDAYDQGYDDAMEAMDY
ncbi:unnamed protein product [Withania somnifera]